MVLKEILVYKLKGANKARKEVIQPRLVRFSRQTKKRAVNGFKCANKIRKEDIQPSLMRLLRHINKKARNSDKNITIRSTFFSIMILQAMVHSFYA